MLNFRVACAQEFQTKNSFFGAARKYGMLLLICKILLRRKYRCATLENAVFSISRCFKNA